MGEVEFGRPGLLYRTRGRRIMTALTSRLAGAAPASEPTFPARSKQMRVLQLVLAFGALLVMVVFTGADRTARALPAAGSDRLPVVATIDVTSRLGSETVVLTGWAQVRGRNALSWDEKFALDRWYVENASLALDCRIAWLTAAAVAARQGIARAGEATMPRFEGGPAKVVS